MNIHPKKLLQPLPLRAAAWTALLTTALGAAAMLFCSPTSWPHDDWDISLVLMGRFGEQNAINFVNVALSFAFRALCAVSANINWFFWLRWLFSAVAFGVILYAALITLPFPAALAADGVIKLVFWQVCFVQCNFTRSAALFAAGGLVLLTLFARKQAGWWGFASGLVLWAMGALWRPEAGLLAAPFAFVLLFWAWVARIQKARDWLRAAQGVLCQKRLWMALLGAAAVTAGTWMLQMAFWSQPGWAESKKFSNARSYFTDHASGGWEDNRQVLEAAGFTENDYWCMEHQSFADPEFFDLERMELLGSLRLKVAPKTAGEFLKERALPFLLQLPFETRSFLAFCLIGGMIFLLGGWRQRLTVLAAGGGGLAMGLVLLWQGYLPQRVLEAIFLAATVAVMLLPPQKHLKHAVWLWSGAGIFAVCAAMLAMRLAAGGVRWPKVNTIPAGQTADAAVNTAANDKEHVYIWDIYSTYNRVQQAYSLCALPDKDFYSNNTILGGYHEYAPYMIETRRTMGAENPMRALVENPRVLLLDDYMPEKVLLYVQEHYEQQAALSAAKDMGDGLWALALTRPLEATETKRVDWWVDDLKFAGGREGWYTVEGAVKGLEKAEVLWLRIEDTAGVSRCYQLVDLDGDLFGTGLYLDWTEQDSGFTYTLLWRENGVVYRSDDFRIK